MLDVQGTIEDMSWSILIVPTGRGPLNHYNLSPEDTGAYMRGKKRTTMQHTYGPTHGSPPRPPAEGIFSSPAHRENGERLTRSEFERAL